MLWALIPHLAIAAAQVVIPSPVQHSGDVDSCQGYVLKVTQSDCGLDGELTLKGKCGAYGPDYERLKLTVRHDNDDRLRVRIADAEGKAHVVPDDVVQEGWPKTDGPGQPESNLQFDYTEDPFTFKVTRKSDGEVIFDTSGQALIFEEQYVRVKSALAEGSNIQGAAQSSDNFTLPITEENYVRTLWNRDAYGVPARTNLYGSHPIIVNQKVGENPSASGIFLLNSNGMDIKFPEQGKFIEYNTLGGIADFFFLNGPTPADVSRQAAQIWKPSPMVPYWSLGLHSCRYGYEDIFDVAEVIANYSAAGIPMQTQWMDIDYMYERWIMTLDPPRFALDKVQYVIDTLHNASQQFIAMVDPATYSGMESMPASDYEAFQSGLQQKIFLAYDDGNVYQGVVWPGPTAFPDWTAENAQAWWDSEFMRFFNTESGVNVDGIWLDMNEPAVFLPYISANIYRVSAEREAPPVRKLPRTIPRSIERFPRFEAGKNISDPWGEGQPESGPEQVLGPQNDGRSLSLERRQNDNSSGNYPESDADYLSPGLDSQWLYPPYRINDRRAPPSTSGGEDLGVKNISDFTARTDLVQGNGARMYSEHNLYGSRHSIVTRNSLLKRNPNLRPFTVARASFSGTPSAIWMGDNLATWEQYISTIPQMLSLSAVSGVGVVGADSCGFGGNTTETLCARWAWLGAFNTFYRNHNEISSISQEFYRWPITAAAAKAAGKVRLQLLDYTYTAVHQHSVDGTPTVWPVSWVHPQEAESVKIETEFYYGPNILVAPVVHENSTSVDVWFAPGETFYDYFTLQATQGEGWKKLNDVGYETMPLYIRAGSVVPLRKGDAMTTEENMQLPFELVVTPGKDGKATGSLYADDGESLDSACSDIHFEFDGSKLCFKGSYNHPVHLSSVVIAGQDKGRNSKVYGPKVHGQGCETEFDEAKKTVTVKVDLKLDCDLTIELF